ncbi:PAS domain-containing sensor histidine kinase [Rhodocytophaga rosea]|uniref:histidine kinase n=1 Tax=Rhodocytophaga rosea TaxID=2704465 RepID=A0A6C0GC88_9BACT|nr:PAS domain-containing sensor histidine kinase [Rhodocytophaga rosea]QHT65442.1 PAS domain-containing sensor histidine kinase [Rhodocytophaga rosea]
MSEKEFGPRDNDKRLLQENMELRRKLQESEEILEAIRMGTVDALTIQGPDGPQIYTIKGADHTYRILIEEMNEGALTLNQAGVILYSNSHFATLINLPLEKVIGGSFYTFLQPEDHTRFQYLFSQGWNKNSKGDFFFRTDHGDLLPFLLSINALPGSDPPALGMIVTDLSAEKEILAVKTQVELQTQIISRKEEELLNEKQTKEEAQRFRIVLEGIPQIAWTSTPDGLINYANLFWHQYTGLSEQETKGNAWLQALYPPDVEGTLAYFNACLQTGEQINFESRFKRASDGMYRWHVIKASPVRNLAGEIILWVGTCTDIHDQKEYTEKLALAKQNLVELNDQLTEKNEQLIRTNNDLDTFIYTASHDLKAPVVNIEGLIKNLERKLEREKVLKENDQLLIEMIYHSILRFKATIQDLAEIVKIQKTFKEDAAIVSIEEIIADVKESIGEMLIQTNAKIILDVARVPQLHISRNNLKSIMYNLISNAVKYRSKERVPEIIICTEKVDQFVCMTIQDNGLGMELPDKDKIFLMFKRLHDHVEGTGVGLYIVKKIIDNMGGKIEVESQVGKGSIFKIYFNTAQNLD